MADFPDIHRWPYVCYDTECSGLHFWKHKMFSFSLTSPDGEDFYFDIRTKPRALEWARRELPKAQRIVCANVKFDAHHSREAGILLPLDRAVCTVVRAALIDEHLFDYGLDALGHKYCGVGKDDKIWEELAKIFGGKPTKAAQVGNLPRAPESIVGRYAMQDTNTLRKLYLWQEEEIKRQGLERVDELERRLIPVLYRMEHRGVPVDVEKAEKAAIEIDVRSKTVQRDLNKLAGFEVNPNPSGSIKDLFKPKKENGVWTLCDGTIAESTPAGACSINAEVLRSMKHPAAAMILSLRKMIKTRDTFLRGHILGHHDNGIVHANFNQTKSDNDMGTGTGRLSVNDPALQQIHKRDKEIASVVRAIFVPPEGMLWDCHDWAQMDFRIFAHYVNNPVINALYAKDPMTDFHQLASDLTGLPRSARFAGDPNSKQVNLGLVFGMGMGKLASEMGLPYTTETRYNGKGCPECFAETCTKVDHVKSWLKPGPEAEAVFENYHANIPGINKMLKNASSVAKSRGHVLTALGRRIRFPRGQFTHKAGGLIFQGTAADALKVKLVELDAFFEASGTGAHLMLNVHDEFDSAIPKDALHLSDEITRIVQGFDTPESQIRFRVPIRSEGNVGLDWWEACR